METIKALSYIASVRRKNFYVSQILETVSHSLSVLVGIAKSSSLVVCHNTFSSISENNWPHPYSFQSRSQTMPSYLKN